MYNKITKSCFAVEPKKRSTFTKVVDIIEQQLTDTEKDLYQELSGRYHSLGKMRQGSIAALKQEVMTQTSIDENKALLQQLMEKGNKGSTLINSRDVPNPTGNHNRIAFRRLTSVF